MGKVKTVRLPWYIHPSHVRKKEEVVRCRESR